VLHDVDDLRKTQVRSSSTWARQGGDQVGLLALETFHELTDVADLPHREHGPADVPEGRGEEGADALGERLRLPTVQVA